MALEKLWFYSRTAAVIPADTATPMRVARGVPSESVSWRTSLSYRLRVYVSKHFLLRSSYTAPALALMLRHRLGGMRMSAMDPAPACTSVIAHGQLRLRRSNDLLGMTAFDGFWRQLGTPKWGVTCQGVRLAVRHFCIVNPGQGRGWCGPFHQTTT